MQLKLIWAIVLGAAFLTASCQRKSSGIETPAPSKKERPDATPPGNGNGNFGGNSAGGNTSDTDSQVRVEGTVAIDQVRSRFPNTPVEQLRYRFYSSRSSTPSEGNFAGGSGALGSISVRSGQNDFYVEVSNAAGQKANATVSKSVSGSRDTVNFTSLNPGAAPVPPQGGNGGGGSGGGGGGGGGGTGGGTGGSTGGSTGGTGGGTDASVDINIIFGTWKGNTDEGSSRWNIK